jgi:hypothetical protein
MQADGIVGEDVVAQAEYENFGEEGNEGRRE